MAAGARASAIPESPRRANGDRCRRAARRDTIYPHQLERLTRALERGRAEVLVATSPANVAYVTGFRGVARERHPSVPELAVFTQHGAALIVREDNVGAALAETTDVHIASYRTVPGPRASDAPPADASGPAERDDGGRVTAPAPDPAGALRAALAALGAARGPIGVDESGVDDGLWSRLAGELSGRGVVPAADALADARRVKAPYEIECLAHALRIAEEALDAVVQALERGMTERDAATLYATEALKRGAIPWPAIVAMGEHACISSPWPTERSLRAGDVVRLDAACRYKGYAARVARTAILGEPPSPVDAAFGPLLAALEAATAAIAPGAASARLLEAAATAEPGGASVICAVRGIGLDMREAPFLDGDAVTFEQGEVLCVEANRFERGAPGLSVADTILVTSGGARVLNRSRHELIVLD